MCLPYHPHRLFPRLFTDTSNYQRNRNLILLFSLCFGTVEDVSMRVWRNTLIPVLHFQGYYWDTSCSELKGCVFLRLKKPVSWCWNRGETYWVEMLWVITDKILKSSAALMMAIPLSRNKLLICKECLIFSWCMCFGSVIYKPINKQHFSSCEPSDVFVCRSTKRVQNINQHQRESCTVFPQLCKKKKKTPNI